MAGRKEIDAIVQSAHLVPAETDGLIYALAVPTGRNPGSKEGLHFGGDVEDVAMPGVEKRFDAKAVASREKAVLLLIPDCKSEFSAKLMKALRAEFLIEMQRDFTVGAGAEVVAARCQLALDGFVTIELAVGDDTRALVFARNWLVAGGKVDDAEPRVSEANAI